MQVKAGMIFVDLKPLQENGEPHTDATVGALIYYLLVYFVLFVIIRKKN